MRELGVLLVAGLAGCAEPQTAVLVDGEEFALQFPSSGAPCASGSLEPSSLVTVEGWYRIDADHSDTIQPLAVGNGLAIWFGIDGRLYVNEGEEAPTGISAPVGIDDGSWHHVAVTWDTFEAFIFIDGIRLGSGALARQGSTPGASWSLGCWPGVGHLEGLMDEVRVSGSIRYDDDFTPQAPLQADDATRALWRFDEGIGTTTTGELGTTLTLTDTYWSQVNGAAGQGEGTPSADTGG